MIVFPGLMREQESYLCRRPCPLLVQPPLPSEFSHSAQYPPHHVLCCQEAANQYRSDLSSVNSGTRVRDTKAYDLRAAGHAGCHPLQLLGCPGAQGLSFLPLPFAHTHTHTRAYTHNAYAHICAHCLVLHIPSCIGVCICGNVYI